MVADSASSADLKAFGATPHVLSLEDASSEEISSFLSSTKAEGVVFAAGAGGKEGPERTRAVDYEGALKVFQACQDAQVPRIVIISAVDVRDVSKPPPEWYNEESGEYRAVPIMRCRHRCAVLCAMQPAVHIFNSIGVHLTLQPRKAKRSGLP